MALVTTQVPYEFLARWNAVGTLTGAHVKLLTVVTDSTGAQPPQYMEGAAQPVALNVGDVGFPLASIMTSLQTSAVTDMQAAQVVAAKAVADLDAANSVLAAVTQKLTAANAALAAAKLPTVQ